MSLAHIPEGSRLNLIRDQLAPGAPDDELAWFGAVADRLELDPFAGHIVLIPRWDNRVGATSTAPDHRGRPAGHRLRRTGRGSS